MCKDIQKFSAKIADLNWLMFLLSFSIYLSHYGDGGIRYDLKIIESYANLVFEL